VLFRSKMYMKIRLLHNVKCNNVIHAAREITSRVIDKPILQYVRESRFRDEECLMKKTKAYSEAFTKIELAASTPSVVQGMTLNCIHIFIVTGYGSFLY